VPLTLIGFMESFSMARKYALQYKYEIDINQEALALGRCVCVCVCLYMCELPQIYMVL
jgi:MFS superfamily sulfate permease-like transporter